MTKSKNKDKENNICPKCKGVGTLNFSSDIKNMDKDQLKRFNLILKPDDKGNIICSDCNGEKTYVGYLENQIKFVRSCVSICPYRSF